MRHLALLLALVAPLPALALSCLAPSVERSFEEFDTATQSYIVVHGRLTFDSSGLPKTDLENQNAPRSTSLPALLIGRSLNDEGFNVPFDHRITLTVACFGPWCGSAQDGGDVLAFLRKEADGYALEITPCGGGAFWEPSGRMLRTVERCFRGEVCLAE